MALNQRFKGLFALAKLPKITKPNRNPVDTPDIVPFNSLPYPIKQWIQFVVRERYISTITPEKAAEGLFPWMARRPAIYKNEQYIDIPNPFLRHRLQLDHEVMGPNPKPETRVISPINKRKQKHFVSLFPRHKLPPSVRNPLETQPLIKMDMNGGTETKYLRYGPDWTLFPETKKGMYSNRTRVFKGHKRERVREIRREEIADRVHGMDARVQKWRESKEAERRASKPQMPW